MKTIVSSIFMGICSILFLLGCDPVFPPAQVVTDLVVEGVTAPATGATPVGNVMENDQYTGLVSWSGNPTIFLGSTVYTASITILPKMGYTLEGITANSFSVPGALNVMNSSNSGVIIAVFPVTNPEPDVVINIQDIQGVVQPVTGAVPVTSITETTQFTGVVSWSGTPTTFAANTVYTATITLTPKQGYSLHGVAADFFSVTGALGYSHVENSGVVTAFYPSTAAITVNVLSLPGVLVPVTGTTPSLSIETDQYTGSINWSPVVTSQFISNTTYTATITLLPKSGYTLNGVTANSFVVPGATVTNSANSGLVAAVFPITSANFLPVTDLGSTYIYPLKGIRGGTFHNGTSNMTVSSFRMGTYEITGQQYLTIMGVEPSHFSSVFNHPVEGVNWYDAVEFCNKLSSLEGLRSVYTISNRNPESGYPIQAATVVADWTANGYRLPTEAEWEFAARGGNSSNNYTFSGSNILNDVAWHSGNSVLKTHSVGLKLPNELGLFDMSGNVVEWVWDTNGVYPSNDRTDYKGPTTGYANVTRGGCWVLNHTFATVSYRWTASTYVTDNRFGFRVARN